MEAVRVEIPVEREDTMVVVTIDLDEVKKAAGGSKGRACVVIRRETGSPLHALAHLDRV